MRVWWLSLLWAGCELPAELSKSECGFVAEPIGAADPVLDDVASAAARMDALTHDASWVDGRETRLSTSVAEEGSTYRLRSDVCADLTQTPVTWLLSTPDGAFDAERFEGHLETDPTGRQVVHATMEPDSLRGTWAPGVWLGDGEDLVRFQLDGLIVDDELVAMLIVWLEGRDAGGTWERSETLMVIGGDVEAGAVD